MKRSALCAAVLAALLALSARATGEFRAHGFVLPAGSVKVDEDRYRLSAAWDDARRFYRSVYPTAKFPRTVLANLAGVRAEHIENPAGGEWDGANIYEKQGEVRVYVLKRKAPAKGKQAEEGEVPTED